MTEAQRPIRGLVTVPVYNEAANLPRVIEKLKSRIPGSNLLFVDDGSTDGSREILQRAGVRYVRHPINLGYEEALRTGMREVMLGGYDYVVYFDADGQHQIEDLETIIRVHEREDFDLVQGSRYRGERMIRQSLRSIGTWAFSRLTTLFAGVEITDVTCGLKLISRRFIPVALMLPTEDMHAELIVGLARCGATIREEKITVTPREAGQSMYHFGKALFYPPKTMICLIGEVLFCRQLRKTLEPFPPRRPLKPDAAIDGDAP
jgi:glycosyltransferase involved in cell wall biosynthesis